MFQIFSKNSFLVDLLFDMVDIHNHILPGIDDGAQSLEESVAMIKEFKEIGISQFICTPHIMHNYHDNTPQSIAEAESKLKNRLLELDIKGTNIKSAAEHMIDDDFENKLNSSQIIPLNDDHILIEMSYLQPSINFDQSIKKIIGEGFFPVFAHPERYQYLNNDLNKYHGLKSKGLKFQLNLLSLGGYYGNDVKKAAISLLEKEMYDFIGSDAHNLRHIQTLNSIKIKESLKVKVLQLKSNNQLLA